MLFRLRLTTSVAIFGASCLLVSCGDEPDPIDVYQVRGVVTALPNPENMGADLRVHHEAIPEFIGYDGTAQPMPEMDMAFPAPAGVVPIDLSVGDKVAIQLEVNRGKNRGYRATRVRPLASDTPLDLQRAEDP